MADVRDRVPEGHDGLRCRGIAHVYTVHEVPRPGLGRVGGARGVAGVVSRRDEVRLPGERVICGGAGRTREVQIDRQLRQARYLHVYWVAQDLPAGGNRHRGVTAEGQRLARAGDKLSSVEHHAQAGGTNLDRPAAERVAQPYLDLAAADAGVDDVAHRLVAELRAIATQWAGRPGRHPPTIAKGRRGTRLH